MTTGEGANASPGFFAGKQMTKDTEIQESYRQAMQQLASDLDQIFNGKARGEDRQTCFVLLIHPFHDARFEGQPEVKGTA